MIRQESVTVGTDAELPVFLATGEPCPVTGFVRGSKQKPTPLGKLGPGFFIQQDNVNLEFNIPPAQTAAAFQKNIQRALTQIGQELPPFMHTRFESAVIYKPEFLDHPEVQRFGCDPDFCVYTKEENPKPRCDDPNLRTAAAHIHVGWEDPTNEDRDAMVRMMDLYVGLGLIRLENPLRKKLYGKAGAYRPKKYGVEYRSPGNGWLQSHSATVFDFVQAAVSGVNNGLKLTKKQEEILIRTINNGHITEEAMSLANEFGVWVV